VVKGRGPRADTNDVPALPSISRAAVPAAPTLEFPRTTPVRALVVRDHALLRVGLRQGLGQDGLSVVDADTARAALRPSVGRAPDVAVIGGNRPAGESISLIRKSVRSAAVLVLELTTDNAHVAARGTRLRPRPATQGRRTRPDHRVATRMSACGCGRVAALTLRQCGGKRHGKKADDTVRRDLRKSMVKRLVPETPTS